MFGATWVLISLTQFPAAERVKTNDGQCEFWRSRSFSWAVDSAGNPETPFDTEFQAIDRALATWGAAVSSCSDLTFPASIRVPDAGTRYSFNGSLRNTIIFRQVSCSAVVPKNDPCQTDDSCADRFHCWNHSASALSHLTTQFDPTTGEIFNVDLELNVPNFIFTTVDAPACVRPNYNVNCVATDLESSRSSSRTLARLLALPT